MTYRTHSDNNPKIAIRAISTGFIIEYKHLLSTKEAFVQDIDELHKWLIKFYKEV